MPLPQLGYPVSTDSQPSASLPWSNMTFRHLRNSDILQLWRLQHNLSACQSVPSRFSPVGLHGGLSAQPGFLNGHGTASSLDRARNWAIVNTNAPCSFSPRAFDAFYLHRT